MSWRVYFFTFGVYARRLHGSSQGSYANNDGRVGANFGLHKAMADSLKSSPMAFTTRQRVWLHNAIYSYCIRHGLIVDALNVRTNHVHLVVSTRGGQTHAEIMKGLKGAIARRMHEEGIVPATQQIWERRYAYTRIRYYKTWYYCVNYTLFRQGSNGYLRDTRLVRRYHVPFESGEPNMRALLLASANERVNGLRKKTLESDDSLKTGEPQERAQIVIESDD